MNIFQVYQPSRAGHNAMPKSTVNSAMDGASHARAHCAALQRLQGSTVLRRSLFWMLLSSATFTPSLTWAQAPLPSGPTDVSGVKFDVQMDLHGTKLLLNGAGTRYKFVVKVYAAGLYVPVRINTPEAAWDNSAPRALKIVMLRDIDANELGKLFTRGMQDNTTREEFGKAIPGTLKLADLFSARKKLVAGDYFIVDYQPGVGTAIIVNGKAEGETIKEPEFFSALMKIWVGKAPADYQLKDALLGLNKR